MATDKQFQRFLEVLERMAKTAGEQGLKVSLEIELGNAPDEDDQGEDSPTIQAISDHTGTHHHPTETDIHLGFSSPAGNQFWEDEELNK